MIQSLNENSLIQPFHIAIAALVKVDTEGWKKIE